MPCGKVLDDGFNLGRVSRSSCACLCLACAAAAKAHGTARHRSSTRMKSPGSRAKLGYHSQYVVDGGRARIVLATLVTSAVPLSGNLVIAVIFVLGVYQAAKLVFWVFRKPWPLLFVLSGLAATLAALQ